MYQIQSMKKKTLLFSFLPLSWFQVQNKKEVYLRYRIDANAVLDEKQVCLKGMIIHSFFSNVQIIVLE